MEWLLLALLFLTVLTCWLFHHLMVRELTAQHRATMDSLIESHRVREGTWELKEERLLNRCMTKDWQSYTQVTSAMVSSTSEPGEGIGLSDESEARAWANAHGELEIGDVLFEQDLRELGITE